MEIRIQKDLVAAMKEKNVLKIAALREIKTAIMKYKTAADYKGTCTDADIISIIQKLVKQHTESYDIYTKAGRTDLASEEFDQMTYLKQYLPQMMTNEQLEKVINEVIRDLHLSSIKDMGKVMKELTPIFKGKADMKLVNTIVKEKLNQDSFV